MLIVLAAAASAVLWVLLWGLGAKAMDALMLSLLIMVLAATAQAVLPFLPGNRAGTDEDPDPAPFN
jgi:hypothetical protein